MKTALGRGVHDERIDRYSAVAEPLETRDDRDRVDGRAVEDEGVSGLAPLALNGRIAGAGVDRWGGLAALDGHLVEGAFGGDDALARVEGQPIGEPVVGIHVVDPEPVERRDEPAQITGDPLRGASRSEPLRRRDGWR